jgi:hypothetical protein
LSVASTLALAGNATVAEMADAAMMEKRLKFMVGTSLWCVVSSLDRRGRGMKVTPEDVLEKIFSGTSPYHLN